MQHLRIKVYFYTNIKIVIVGTIKLFYDPYKYISHNKVGLRVTPVLICNRLVDISLHWKIFLNFQYFISFITV